MSSSSVARDNQTLHAGMGMNGAPLRELPVRMPASRSSNARDGASRSY
jgi:hypothetical protein